MTQKKWFAGVTCGRCGAHVPWVEDPSRSKVKLVVSERDAKISLTCPAFGLAATYPFTQVHSFADGTSSRLN